MLTYQPPGQDAPPGLHWPIGPNTTPERRWEILIEAGALSADPLRIKDLARKWHCTPAAARGWATACGIDLQRHDNGEWCASIRHGRAGGWGRTPLEALSGLAMALGYDTSKPFLTLVQEANYDPSAPSG